MKAFVLQKIAEHISTKHIIQRAIRVDDNIILLQIDKTKYFFDMTRGNSDIYIDIEYELAKKFNAPFDILLTKKFTKAQILDVVAKERILTIKTQTNLQFKTQVHYIRFEFTGRYTNVIILDENFIVLQALHHISKEMSSRAVEVGCKLEPLAPKQIKEKQFDIDDIITYTQNLFYQKYNQRLHNLKKSLIAQQDKKIKLLQKRLSLLEDKDSLLQKSELYKKYADLAMINLHKINKYDKELQVEDFEGNMIQIPIVPLKNMNEIGTYYYNLSKKAKAKAHNIHLQQQNIQEKLDFLQNYKMGIQNATSISQLNILKSPKKSKQKQDNIQQFFIDDFLVLVGKNEAGNIQLLQTSKANDIWLHIKDKPGAHVIIKTNKKNVPSEVIYKAAKLALIFSNQKEGVVDYTQRRNLYIKKGAFVNYVTYKSIKVSI
ncbi:MAG: DUF814 domain-containing protein [Epsilonproteobacteria bacterium]|nr:DUF814 domain-containing protein [Campylobacterota bacterium]